MAGDGFDHCLILQGLRRREEEGGGEV